MQTHISVQLTSGKALLNLAAYGITDFPVGGGKLQSQKEFKVEDNHDQV